MEKYRIIRVRALRDAKSAEKFIFNALKPGGFNDSGLPIPSLKDHLAWLSYANIRRPEQPSFIAFEGHEIIAGIFGEPVETTFDLGESEIQEVIFKPGYESPELSSALIGKIVSFYKNNNAKQAHFWVLETDFNKNSYSVWKQVAIDTFGFAFKGFRRISKWSGKQICKIEKVF